jgi:hypothetical protein
MVSTLITRSTITSRRMSRMARIAPNLWGLSPSVIKSCLSGLNCWEGIHSTVC